MYLMVSGLLRGLETLASQSAWNNPDTIWITLAAQFHRLFVNRRAYTLQSFKPHPEMNRHYYFRPKAAPDRPAPGLNLEILRQHLAGDLTVGLSGPSPSEPG